MMHLNIDDLSGLENILEKHSGQKGMLIPILQEAQAEYGYIFEGMINRIADSLEIHPSQVYGVATFYAQFYFEPRGHNIIRVCRGTACHVRGSHSLIETVEEKLGIQDGESTKDMVFTLETVACLGACAQAPVVMINDVYYGQVTSARLDELFDECRKVKADS